MAMLAAGAAWPASPAAPLPSPGVRAMLNYVGLSVDGYVFTKITVALNPDYPQLARLMPTADSPPTNPEEIAADERRVADAVYPVLRTLKDLRGERLQLVLLAIDHLADFLPDSAVNRQRMAKYGLHVHSYGHNEGWSYDHDLLWRAWKLDPESDLGKDAFLLLLERGFDPSNNCLFGTDNFLRVVHYAEPWLAARPHDPRVVFVTFMLARAYHTWWVLGHDGNPADRRYIPGSNAAYRKGVADYEQVITQLNFMSQVFVQERIVPSAPLPKNYDYPSLIAGMTDAAQTELQRLENKQFDFTAFDCIREE
ncbi:MAG: hypothetical protein ACYDDO_13150 [Acidiferrobacterales bacterium]